MPYSPEDIVAYAFRTRARGYDRDEVDAFLDELADQIEQERARSATLEERVTALEADLTEADESERALKRTLITVQDAADRALTEAQEEVAELRAEADREIAARRERTEGELAEQRARAEAEAARLLDAARAEVAAQQERVRHLQELDAGHRAQLRDHLEGQFGALAALPDPFADLDLGVTAEGAGAAEDPAADDAVGAGADEGAPAQEDPAADDPWRRSADLEPDEPGPGADDEGSGDDADGQRPDGPMWG